MATDVIIDPSTGQIYWNDSAGVGTESISIRGDAVNTISIIGYGAAFSPGSTPTGAQTLVTIKDSGGTDALIPGTTGYNLGSSTLRWNTFATNANLSGTLLVGDATNTTSLITGAVRLNGGIAISSNASIGQTLLIFNGANYSGFRSGATGNTVYTLPATSPATGSSVLSSTADGVMSWVPMVASSSSAGSGTVATPGAQYQVAAYYFSATGASVSGSTTFTNNTATGVVNISHLTASTSTSTGALTVSGGAGVALTLNVGGTISSIGASIYGPLYTNNIQIGQGGNNINFLDAAGATLGNFNTSNGWFRSAQTTNSSSTSTGALVSAGGLGIASNAFIGGTVNITSSQTSIATNNGALVVTGGVGIGGSLYTSAGSTSSVSGVLLANGNVSATTYNKLSLTAPATSATLTLANGSSLITSGANSLTLTTTATSSVTMPTAGTLTTTGNKLSVFAATTSNELLGVISDETGSGLLVFNTSPDFTTSVTTGSATFSLFNTNATTINALQAGTAISLGAATGTITLNNAITLHNQTTASTSPTTGAIVVNGGVGIGLSASIGGRLQLFNGANFTAFVSAATANTVYTLPPTSPATGSSVLQSTSAGVMSWVPMTAGGGPSGTINSSTINNIAYYTGSTTLSGDTLNSFYYNSASNGLVIANPDNETVSSASTGLLRIGTGATNYAVRKALAVFSTNNAWTDGDLLVLGLGNAAANQRVAIDYRGYIQIGVPGTGFTLPVANGTSGQVLTANTNGVASWTTVSSSGAGSGTVAIPGAQYQVAAYYHSATGASVSGSSTFTNNTATGTVNITHTTPSTSTTTGALTISGSVGLGGSLYVGGQINQTFAPSTGAAIDHAVFLQSNPVPTTIGSLIQIGSAARFDGTTAGFFTGSSSGTFIGINAASGNTSSFIDFQENGVSVFSVGAGGTNIRLGQSLGYDPVNVLATFVSTVNSYNQLVIRNKSNGTSASANLVVNNDSSTDTTFYGELGINSSTFTGSGPLNAPNATYVAATSGPLVLATTTAHPVRIAVNSGATDMLYFSESGLAISCFANFGLRSASDLRFWNSGNTFYAGIQGGNTNTNYLLTMPTSPVAVGYSTIVVDSSGNMYFVPLTGGLAATSATGNQPAFRAKTNHHIWFCAGYTPVVAGADSVIFRVPDSSQDGTTRVTFQLEEFSIRVETPSAGSSRIQVERSSLGSTGAFTLAATGSSIIGGLGLTISGAGTYITSFDAFAAGSFVTSGDVLRLNWTLLNATHANFSVQLTINEI